MKSSLKYGLITGVCVSVWLFIACTIIKISNLPSDKFRAVAGLLSFIVLLSGIYFGLKAVRSHNNGSLSYKEAALTGIKISVVVAVVVSIYGVLYNTLIDPGYTELMLKETEKTIRASGAGEAEVSAKMESAKKQYSVVSQMMQGLTAQFVIGTVGSLVMGFFMKRGKGS